MKETSRLYVDFHVIQTVPPSCLNRDDTGSPKTAVYGGVTRARVSSQCWKRAQREMFRQIFPQELLGQRTKRIVPMVAEEIRALNLDAETEKLAQKVLEAAGLKIKSADKGTDAMFFMSQAQARALARIAVEEPELMAKDKNRVKKALLDYPGIDIALFGRMVADDPSLNNDACAQVAHSISTHRVSNEYDYFTAVDDLSPEDSAGAGHIGTVEFNSATLYRYATVAVHQLYKQLGKDTVSALRGFGESFALSMPTGKQNTFANRSVPDALYVALRTDQPVSLAGAFERPVKAGEEGYVAPSLERFCRFATKTYGDFIPAPKQAWAVGEGLTSLAGAVPLRQLLDALEQSVAEELANGEET